ncbi:hypothetical protein [Pseudonocardia alni]|uniref:hypothetical protein n=1 Tax=Pseudonocardia alni TaxID=33907 RepID=UPI00332A1E0C
MPAHVCDRCGEVTVDLERCRCATATTGPWPARRPGSARPRAARPTWRTRPVLPRPERDAAASDPEPT